LIVYSLHCEDGHAFEGWFGSSAAYDEQSASGKLTCPICDTRKISKAPMAPAVSGTKSKGTSPEETRKLRQFATGIRKYVVENAEYVGPKFPEEARKIHYGESDDRHIYGEATLKEAKEMVEEGLDVAPLPPDPGEAN
jgi:hypothetical protein